MSGQIGLYARFASALLDQQSACARHRVAVTVVNCCLRKPVRVARVNTSLDDKTPTMNDPGKDERVSQEHDNRVRVAPPGSTTHRRCRLDDRWPLSASDLEGQVGVASISRVAVAPAILRHRHALIRVLPAL